MIRAIGKGQHLDPARPAPHHDVIKGGKEILVEVTTDATGAVANIRFLKSSGSEAVDDYVSETIRSGLARRAHRCVRSRGSTILTAASANRRSFPLHPAQ